MSEVERRRAYNAQRVLMSSVAVLNPTFDDGDLYFTGSQIEIMRNLMQYANRPENYAAEWEPGYYLTPDNDDWDQIQAIVADLEETLMGNPNTLWGYKDKYKEYLTKPSDPGGQKYNNGATVPEGEVWVIQNIHAYDDTTVIARIVLEVYDGAAWAPFKVVDSPAVYEGVEFNGTLVLAEDEKVRCEYVDTVNGENLYLMIRGYKMLVP